MAEENHRPVLVVLRRVGIGGWELVEREQAAEMPSPERRPSPMPSPQFDENGEWIPFQVPSPVYGNNNGNEEREEEVSPPPSPDLLANEEEDDDILLLDDENSDNGYESDSQNIRLIRDEERDNLEPEYLIPLIEYFMKQERSSLMRKIGELEVTVRRYGEQCDVIRSEINRINRRIDESINNGNNIVAYNAQKQFLINTLFQHYVAKTDEYTRASYELQLSKNRLQMIRMFIIMREM